MRYRFIILAFCFIYAGFSQNNLRVFSKDGARFNVYVDDTVINIKYQSEVLITEILTDTLRIKIGFENKSKAEATLYLLEKGKAVNNKEFNYLIETKSNKTRFVFTGLYPIIATPDPIVPVKPVVDTSYKLRNNLLGHYCELKEGKILFFNNLPAKNCVMPMPAKYIEYLNFLIKRAQTEDDKYSIAENTCMNNCISVSQLNRVLVFIPYEIEKIKLIKTAYPHITDKNNKRGLDSTFKLESSKNELASFLKNANENTFVNVDCKNASPEEEIAKLLNNLTAYSNDAAKFDLIKKNVSAFCYTSKHIETILNSFIHDREKLDVAKLLYFYCVDKDNFLSIIGVFAYNTTTAELKDFVGKQKNQ